MTTHQLLTAELQEMHWFENAWVTILGQLGRSTCLPDLGSILKKERAYTQEHVNRLKQVFVLINEPSEIKECEALAGLLADLKKACEGIGQQNDIECDISFVLAVIKAANYRIGAYSGIFLLADALQYKQVQGLIQDTLGEEKQTILDLQALLSRQNL
ncbi:YciE/YciF ferroxidase family protein [Dyadobacter sediminis]|uniref:DUF892 family protein n=1 Tax=Dyadobacter sediminis TaxID=1493691 RepID=A0A5R9K4B4_9BACT|nr:DUF892 family protein [Dyadobacter sediminis]TLU88691.1 DUF892 family protein [Dyadobacter sediminis]GGC13940.1 hypothetical protein GCM10011325_46090 [Dyadobacter sediminis]